MFIPGNLPAYSQQPVHPRCQLSNKIALKDPLSIFPRKQRTQLVQVDLFRHGDEGPIRRKVHQVCQPVLQDVQNGTQRPNIDPLHSRAGTRSQTYVHFQVSCVPLEALPARSAQQTTPKL